MAGLLADDPEATCQEAARGGFDPATDKLVFFTTLMSPKRQPFRTARERDQGCDDHAHDGGRAEGGKIVQKKGRLNGPSAAPNSLEAREDCTKKSYLQKRLSICAAF